ncbi:MAG: sigma-70 family RNA polymerase sigma factor [Planctomycetota bacterium]|nr:MAG: sigma-70 family RNA polymerase sigma factor [Planctomycetota bacterium]
MTASSDAATEFEELLAPHADKLFGFALRMTRNRAEAEDLLQESVYRAFRSFAGFRRGTNFKAWMFRIVSNCFISSKRRERRAPVLMELDGVAEADRAAEEELLDADTDWAGVYGELVDDDVKQAIDALPEDFRAPLLLSSLGGLRYKEIAEALDVPIGTVMSRLFRARQRLRRSLRDYALARGIAAAKEEA